MNMSRWPLLLALILPGTACAGVSAMYEFTSRTAGDNRPARSATRHFTTEIDGARFRIHSGRGTLETSVDDGASTFFGPHPETAQSPLLPGAEGFAAPISASIEDESVSIGPPAAGPALFGMATQVYRVELRYVTVAHIAGVFTRRFRTHAQYTITVAGGAASPAAMRVVLSRGYGSALARHAEALPGLPLRIEAHLDGSDEDAHGTPHHQVTDFTVHARSLAPWSWPESAAPR